MKQNRVQFHGDKLRYKKKQLFNDCIPYHLRRRFEIGHFKNQIVIVSRSREEKSSSVSIRAM